MTAPDPRVWFPEFYDNPDIRMLAGASRWTISGRVGDLDTPADRTDRTHTRKAPIDVRHLLDCGRVRGAWAVDRSCLVTLDELTAAIPEASNAAFYLQTQTDGLVLIDIEPGCPLPVTADLLRLPGILYAELSLSGRGFHLLTAPPRNLRDFPVAATKRVLREEHGWYELLFDHWVTFTRRPVPESVLTRLTDGVADPVIVSVEDLYAGLAERARASAGGSPADIDTAVTMPDIPHARTIIAETITAARRRLRGPEHFDHDLSRWEFSVLGVLYRWLLVPVAEYSSYGDRYTDSDLAWLLFEAAQQVLQERPKHHQRRNGRPYLLDRAAALVADRQSGRGG